MNWKETYTKVFLKQSGKSVSDLSVKEYLPLWWQNTRSKDTGGLRLTDVGYDFIKNTLDLQERLIIILKQITKAYLMLLTVQ